MTEEQSILVDVLKIVADNSICYINAPSINENSEILKLLSPSDDYDWCLTLSADNKQKLNDIIVTESIQDHFHQLDIKNGSEHLCEAYDGMCTVILPNEEIIPNWFKEKYVQDGHCWGMK